MMRIALHQIIALITLIIAGFTRQSPETIVILASAVFIIGAIGGHALIVKETRK